MKILGIESSCDETACSVVEDGRKVLSNVVASQIDEHRLYGGVVPEIASRRHAENISWVTRAAIEEAGCTLDDIDAIAVTFAPSAFSFLACGYAIAVPKPPPITATFFNPSKGVGIPKGPAKSKTVSPADNRDKSFVVFPTA